MSGPISVKAVVLRGRSVLLGTNDRGEEELPGGRPEPGETHEDALVREVREESGLEVRPVRGLGTRVFEVVPGREVLLVGYVCEEVGPLREPVRSAEHGAMRFVPLGGVAALALPEPYRRFLADC